MITILASHSERLTFDLMTKSKLFSLSNCFNAHLGQAHIKKGKSPQTYVNEVEVRLLIALSMFEFWADILSCLQPSRLSHLKFMNP